MPTYRLTLSLTVGTLAALLSGCIVPEPVAHVVLRISASGAYELDGKVFAPDQLAGAVLASEAVAPSMILEIRASPDAGVESVRQAVKAAKSAHARIAFGREPSPTQG